MQDETKQPQPGDEPGEQASTDEELSAALPEGSGEEGEAQDAQPSPEEAQPSEEGGGRSDVSSSVSALQALLRRTERDLRRPVLVEGALWAAAVALAVALSALGVAALFEAKGALAARWILLVGFAAVGVSAAVTYGLFRARRRGVLASATIVQAHERSFRNDLVAALEFGERLSNPGGGEELSRQGVSAALAAAHVRRTAKLALGEAKNQSLAHVVPARDLRAPAGAAGVLGAALLAVLVVNPGWAMGVLSGDRMGESVVGDRVRERPIVGQIDA